MGKSVLVSLLLQDEVYHQLAPQLDYLCQALGHQARWLAADDAMGGQDGVDFIWARGEREQADFQLQDQAHSHEPLAHGALLLLQRQEDGQLRQLAVLAPQVTPREQAIYLLSPLRRYLATFRPQPVFSIAITSYNYAQYIAQTLDSVLSQAADDVELLVLDNCSTDNTPEVLAAYRDDPRVKVITHQRDTGRHNNARSGFLLATGFYYCPLCADDFFMPGYLDALRSLLKREPVRPEVIFTRLYHVDGEGRALNYPPHPGYPSRTGMTRRNELLTTLTRDCYTPPSSTFIQTRLLAQYWERIMHYPGGSDWALFALIVKDGGQAAFIDMPGVAYRWHAQQHTQSLSGSLTPVEDHLQLLEDVMQQGLPDCLRGHEEEVADMLRRRVSNALMQLPAALRQRYARVMGRLSGQARQQSATAPFFSLIVTGWPRPQWLLTALQSLADQRFQDFEIIVLNQGGDAIEPMLSWLGLEERTRYIRKACSGSVAARGEALRLARGQHVCFLEQAELAPDQLLKLHEQLQTATV